MKTVTLCFLIDGDHLCLAMKKRGFGKGKWNGVGGKVEEGETVEEAAVRELKEEIQVDTHVDHLEHVGHLKFNFKDNPDWNQQMHIFFIENWDGDPEETDEMAPEWYHKDEIPYDNMWVDDPYWLPRVLDGNKIKGEFHFIDEGATIDDFTIDHI